MNKTIHRGTSLDDFLREQGMFDEVRAAALAEVQKYQDARLHAPVCAESAELAVPARSTIPKL